MFDCDGVLVDSEFIAMKVEIQELARLGLKISPKYYRRYILGHSEANWFQAIKKLADANGVPITRRTLTSDLSRLRGEAYLKDLAPVKGIYQFLEQFRGDVGVVTSSSLDSVQLKLRKTKLNHFFEKRKLFTIDRVRHGKPHPELYETATKYFEHDQTELLAIEDSVNGVRSAKAAGLTVWGFTGGMHLPNEFGAHLASAGADRVVEYLSIEDFVD